MSGDLHLYVVTGALLSVPASGADLDVSWETLQKATGNWANSNIWIGKVSWMKASMDNDDRWIPAAVERINGLYFYGRVLTPGLALDTLAALNWPDRSYYGRRHYLTAPDYVAANWRFGRRHRMPGGFRAVTTRSYGVTRDRRGVKRWLNDHMGERIIACTM